MYLIIIIYSNRHIFLKSRLQFQHWSCKEKDNEQHWSVRYVGGKISLNKYKQNIQVCRQILLCKPHNIGLPGK